MIGQTREYIIRRRHYLKAFELIKDILIKAYVSMELNDFSGSMK